jgi:hypothetical protein
MRAIVYQLEIGKLLEGSLVDKLSHIPISLLPFPNLKVEVAHFVDV